MGEVQLAKSKTFLVWDIKTRSLRVFIPLEKEIAWVYHIRASLALTKMNTDNLEPLIGNPNNVDNIIPPARYFLNQLRNILKIGKNWGPQRLQSWHIQDLHLWIKILQWVAEIGFLINNILFKTPTVTIWSDTCEYGIGGYNDKGMK